MRDKNRFTPKTRETLAKRAQQTCSNPYCMKPTTGPHTDDDRYVDVGEAAHIRGARPGSKRYDPSMQPEERRSIVNGIWLCRSCAKLIDSDEKRYSVELLYEWKRNHEAEIEGKVQGRSWQRLIAKKYLKPFEDESPTAYQIAIDAPEHWEYLLTIELFRSKLKKIIRLYEELRRGLLYKPSTTLIDKDQLRIWWSEKLVDYEALNILLVVATSEELVSAWGVDRRSGDPIEILQAVNKIIFGCEQLLNWEIDVHFTQFPKNFEPLKRIMQGWTKHTLSEIDAFIKQFSDVFRDTSLPEGEIRLKVILDVPENFGDATALFKKLWSEN